MRMTAKFIFNLFFICFFPLLVSAQADSTKIQRKVFFKKLSVSAMYQNGHVFATNDFLRGTNLESEKINAFEAFSLKFATQTTGKKAWEQIYRYPNWGIELYIANFHNPEEIGIPIAFYGFFNAPLYKIGRN